MCSHFGVTRLPPGPTRPSIFVRIGGDTIGTFRGGAKVPPILGRKNRYFSEVLHNCGAFSWPWGPQIRRFRSRNGVKTCLQPPRGPLEASYDPFITLNFDSQTGQNGQNWGSESQNLRFWMAYSRPRGDLWEAVNMFYVRFRP